MSTDGWLDGYIPDTDDDEPAPSAPLTGPARRTIEVMCCPLISCQSLAVRPTHRKHDTSYWECRRCGTRWNEAPTTGSDRCYQA